MTNTKYSYKGPFTNDVTAKMTIFGPPSPPMSPFVTNLANPPSPHVTGKIVTKYYLKKLPQNVMWSLGIIHKWCQPILGHLWHPSPSDIFDRDVTYFLSKAFFLLYIPILFQFIFDIICEWFLFNPCDWWKQEKILVHIINYSNKRQIKETSNFVPPRGWLNIEV